MIIKENTHPFLYQVMMEAHNKRTPDEKLPKWDVPQADQWEEAIVSWCADLGARNYDFNQMRALAAVSDPSFKPLDRTMNAIGEYARGGESK